DGIRDFHVTGVQTCALPIYALEAGPRDGQLPFRCAEEMHLSCFVRVTRSLLAADAQRRVAGEVQVQLTAQAIGEGLVMAGLVGRSEERRVGKECSCGGAREE